MGPLATVDFLQKLIEETPATRDQDHIPVIVYSVPQIPNRPPEPPPSFHLKPFSSGKIALIS